jgi:predicted nucleic acid-binding Zn ribbon protein
MECANCSANINTGERFCAECGHPAEATAVKMKPEICTRCGAERQPDERFCSECGQDTRVTPPESLVPPMGTARALAETICAHCGAAVKPDKRFCGSCGQPVALEAAAVKIQSCPACGTPADPGERFCGKCGSSLPGTVRSPPTGRPKATEGAAPVASLLGSTSPFQFSALFALGGFVLAAIATFLPWSTGIIDSDSSRSVTHDAWEYSWKTYDEAPVVILVLAGIGLLTLIAPLVYGGMRRMKWAQYLPVIVGVLLATFGVLTYDDLTQGVIATSSGGTVNFIVEIGPYLVIAGGLVAAIGSFLGWSGRRFTAGGS